MAAKKKPAGKKMPMMEGRADMMMDRKQMQAMGGKGKGTPKKKGR